MHACAVAIYFHFIRPSIISFAQNLEPWDPSKAHAYHTQKSLKTSSTWWIQNFPTKKDTKSRYLMGKSYSFCQLHPLAITFCIGTKQSHNPRHMYSTAGITFQWNLLNLTLTCYTTVLGLHEALNKHTIWIYLAPGSKDSKDSKEHVQYQLLGRWKELQTHVFLLANCTNENNLDSNSITLLPKDDAGHFNIKKRRYWHCRTQILDVSDMLVWGALLKKHECYIILASLRHWMQWLAGTCYLKHVKSSVCKLRILDSNSEVEICFWMDLLGQHSQDPYCQLRWILGGWEAGLPLRN